MKLLNFNIIKLLFFLILGIIIQQYFSASLKTLILLLFSNLILTTVFYLTTARRRKTQFLFSLSIFLTFLLFGALSIELRKTEHQPSHYSKFQKSDDYNLLIAKVRHRLKADGFNNKYEVDLINLNGSHTKGKLLFSVSKDNQLLEVGCVYAISNSINEIQKPLNPYQFNYANYLQKKQIHHQILSDTMPVKLASASPYDLYSLADKLRRRINEGLKNSGFKETPIQMINALILGQRQDINPTIYNNFINAGAVHILAVSGLHIGIILLILNTLTKPLLYFKNGRALRPLLIVVILWAFAIIAGLSPSVTRAVAMFSLISIGMHFKRHTNIYNTLFSSAFILLIVNPFFLFEVGFQLSYAAVLSIVSIQPLIYKAWQPRYKLIDKLWQILTVTVAAQIGVAPISLFYFHQFPGLFLLSNLVILPFLGLILGLGLLVVILGLFKMIPPVLKDAFSWVIELLNQFVNWIAQYENFIFKDISFSLSQVVLSYSILISIISFINTKNYKWIITALVGIIGFQVTFLRQDIFHKPESLIVFHKSRYSLIGKHTSNRLVISHNLNDSLFNSSKTISDFIVGENIQSVSADTLQSVYQLNGKTLLVLDSVGTYQNLSFKVNFVLLRESPRINLDRLIEELRPEQIIIDGSNYKSYVERWKFICLKRDLPFHYTGTKGAWILK